MTARIHHWRVARFVPVLAALALSLACIPGTWQANKKPQDTSSGASSEGKENAPYKHSQGFFIHKVRWERESLSIIAKWYTGHMRNWKLLAQHNPMNDPNRIRIGDEIAIPEKLVRTRDPLPKSFVDRYAPKPGGADEVKSPPDVPQGESPEEEVPELFGPKEYKAPHSRREEGGSQGNPVTRIEG